MKKFSRGFTIVELLVVIVVIGILATVVVVAYNGISQRAREASLQSDLTQARKQIEAFYAVNNVYPTANNCTNTLTTEICLKTSSGNTLTYTPNNTTNPTSYTLTGNSGVAAVANYSVYFDGNGDYLSVPSSDAWAFGTGAWCIELWVYPISWAANANYAALIRTVGGAQGFLISNHSNQLRYHIPNVGDILSGPLPSTNTWSHIAVCRNTAGTVSMFINGSRVATTSNSTNMQTSSLHIGGGTDWNTYVNSYISNLRIVKGTAIYDPTQSTFTPPTSRLTAVSGTSLLTAQDATFKDNSTNNLTITKFGDAAVNSLNPF